MRSRTALATIIGVACLTLAACGPEAKPGTSAGGAPSPDEPVTSAPCPVGAEPSDIQLSGCEPRGRPTAPRYQLVTPRPGMEDLHPLAWHRATAKGRTVLVRFYSGVDPCSVLDHVDVVETPNRVAITLYEGHDPDSGSVACIEIAVLKAVKIKLDRPLGGRTLVDRAP